MEEEINHLTLVISTTWHLKNKRAPAPKALEYVSSVSFLPFVQPITPINCKERNLRI